MGIDYRISLGKSTDFSKNILVDWTAPVGALFFPVKETVRTVPLHQVNQLKIIYHHHIRKSTIIFKTAPIYVVILGVFLFKESVSKQFLLSFALTYTGVLGLVYFSNTITEGALLGDALALMAAFMYATYLLIISKLGKESSINIIFYTTLFTCLFGLIPALIESRDFLPTSKVEIYNLFAMALLCQVGGQFFITYSMPKLTASFGSIGLLMQPIVATIFGALIFAEYLNFIQLGFVILALVGIYFARLEINPPVTEGHNET